MNCKDCVFETTPVGRIIQTKWCIKHHFEGVQAGIDKLRSSRTTIVIGQTQDPRVALDSDVEDTA